MGNIDNLNFKIILDDAEFNAKVKSDLDLAKAFNVEVSKLLDIRAEAASVEKKSAEATKEVAAATKTAAEATATHTKKIRNRTREMKSGNEEAKRQSTLMRSLQGTVGAYFSIDGARRFVTELSRITGEFEKQQVALRAILQDTDGADVIFEKIKNLAVVSPFSVLDLTSYAKQLSAFSVPLDEIYDTTKMLADVSAGLGVDMSRVVLAYGQIRSASFLRGTEVRQLTEAGIPILDELAKQFETLEGHAVSVGEVFNRISARQVPFEMVEKAFKDMTSEGGKFYEMQEVLSETLAGKISNLRDSYEIMMSSIGNANSDVLKGAINLLIKMMNNYEQIGADLIALASTYGVYKLAVYATSLATKGFVKTNIALLKGLRSIQLVIMSEPYAAVAAAAVAAGYAIYRVVTAENELEKAQKSVNKTIEGFRTSSSAEISNLDYLWSQLKKASVGTREYDDARKRLMNTYGQYLTDIDKEALAVGRQVDTTHAPVRGRKPTGFLARFQVVDPDEPVVGRPVQGRTVRGRDLLHPLGAAHGQLRIARDDGGVFPIGDAGGREGADLDAGDGAHGGGGRRGLFLRRGDHHRGGRSRGGGRRRARLHRLGRRGVGRGLGPSRGAAVIDVHPLGRVDRLGLDRRLDL